MKGSARSPVRKPVFQNYSQPQRRQKETPLEDELADLGLDEEVDAPVAALAETSPGRISGRNRDTAMFDPRRGTYMPYGDVIDDYYTEGDISGISIPAPSQIQRREQSRSPQRSITKPTARYDAPINGQDTFAHDPRSDQLAFGENVLTREISGQSARHSQSGSLHSSPGRPQTSQGQPPFQEAGTERNNKGVNKELYYDDDVYYSQPSDPQANLRSMNDNPSHMPSNDFQQPSRGNNDRRAQPQPGGYDAPQRRPEDQYNHAYNAPRSQYPPQQLRPQRSMDFPQQNMRAGYPPQGYSGPPRPRDPRAMQQDPRLAPRPPGRGDPRMMPPQARQFRGPPGQAGPPQQRPMEQYDGRNGPNGRGPARTGPPMSAGQGVPYPQSPDEPYAQSRNAPQQAPLQRMRSPPDQRPPAGDFRRPSPNLGRDPRAVNPMPQQPSAMPQQQQQQPARLNPQMREPSPQLRHGGPQNQQGPPVQQQAARQMPQATAHRPEPSRAVAAQRHDSSDMVLQPEPVGAITLQELSALRKEVARNNTPQMQLTLVKRLIEASTVLADEGGKADAKQARKNKDDYSREALRTLKQITAQEKPYPEALFFLANCYGNGALSLEVDHERAFALYEQAAKLQHPASAYRTAVCLEIGAGTRQDVDRAVRFYERAAEFGDPAAMYKLGMILLRGLLEQKANAKAAVAWLQRAAEKADIDNPHALHELGLLYEKGDQAIGISQNEPFAKELFTRAAKLHYAPSQFRMGYAYEYGTLGCPVDPRRSIAWFSRGAERGDPESELSLSGWYLTGSDGILAQNDREAYLWGRKAAEKGLAKAEFAVGYFFESGIGTPMDVDEAIKWYKRAATAGQKKAQERLLALGKRKR